MPEIIEFVIPSDIIDDCLEEALDKIILTDKNKETLNNSTSLIN